MARTKAKSVAITVAAGVLTFGVQQLTAGEVTTGGVGIVVGLVLFFGYQYAEELDHADTYNEIANAIGEETFKRLAELSAEEIETMMDQGRRSE